MTDIVDEVLIYPNPVREIITVEFTYELSRTDEMVVHLYNLTGLDMIEYTQSWVTFNKLEIDMRDLPLGIYFLVIPNGNESSKYKLVKF